MALAASLAVAVYANSLGNGLVHDDLHAIVGNPAAGDPLDWRAVLLTPSWFGADAPSTAYRPLTTWTFALGNAVHGATPLGHHVVNVAAHAVVSAMVVVLALALGATAVAAGMAGALFAVHPIHSEAVANVVGRAELLACAFALVAIVAARRRAPAVAIGAFILALLSKENAIALVALIPAADLLVTDGGSVRRFLRRLRGRRLVCYVGVSVATLGYLWLRSVALGSLVADDPDAIAFWQNPAAFAPPGVRWLTGLGVAARALTLLVAPIHLSADYSFRAIPLVTSAGEPMALAGLVAAGLIASAAGLLRRRPLDLFWLAVGLLAWIPVSNLLVPIGTIFGERLLYLPSVGFCGLVASGLASRRPRTALLLAILLVSAWGTRTVLRNPVWADDLHLAEAMVATAPASVQAHYLLGTAYANRGRDDAALAAFGQALAILPEHENTLYNSAVVLQRRGDGFEAHARLRRAVELNARHFPAWINLAAIDNARGRFTEALASADRAVVLRDDVANAHVVRGFALLGLGRLVAARAAFDRASALAPGSPDALMGRAAVAAARASPADRTP